MKNNYNFGCFKFNSFSTEYEPLERNDEKMKNKKIIILFSVLFIILVVGGYFIIQHMKNEKTNETTQEYTPQEEISEEQSRQTIVTLYFQNKETKELMPEARMVDIKEMVNTPYDKLINLLIEGPKNEKQERIVPENTKLLGTKIDGECITVDFSAEFLNYDKTNEKSKDNLINSIVNTLTELTEINKVKFLVDGTENTEFNETYTRKTT